MDGLLELTFFRYALTAVCIMSVAAAIVGTYIVTRRLVALSGGLTHASFGGLGLGYWLGISPVAMAGVFAVGAALGVEWLGSRGRMRDDSAIAVFWALGMALGTVFVFLTPGYAPELNAFLFGNILTVTRSDLWIYAVFTACLLLFTILRFRQIVICAFDRDFAAVIYLPVRMINTLMTIFVALCIVLTIRMAGIMLLMSLLTLPQLVGELYCRRYLTILLMSCVVSLATCVAGLFAGAVIDVPCSALIVMVQTAVYAVCAAERGMSRRLRNIRA